MIAEIKTEYKKLNKKTAFIVGLSETLEKSPLSLRTHWFTSFWAIPKDYQPKVLKEIKKELKKQEA